MRVWTSSELLRLTRADLFALYRNIANAFAAMAERDPERPIALANLQNIRKVLARPNFAPR